MGSPWPILFIVSFYLYFVLKWGPAYMKNRNPFNIDRIVMVYNAVQVLFSFYLVKEVRISVMVLEENVELLLKRNRVHKITKHDQIILFVLEIFK